jgi:putative peptidoglycan lipid II flippase
VNVALLAGTLIREDSWRPSAAFLSRLSRIFAASLIMAGLLFAASLGYPVLSRLFLAKEAAVLIVCAAGAAAYGVCLLLFRAVTLSELKGTLRREPGAGPVSGLD